MAFALKKVLSQRNTIFLKYAKNCSIATTTQKKNLVIRCKYHDFSLFIYPSVCSIFYPKYSLVQLLD